MSAADDVGLELLRHGTPRAHLLSNGRYQTVLTAAGSGYSACQGYALSRWTADRTADADGFFLYVAEPATGAWWSAGYEPSRRTPGRYHVEFLPGSATIVREDAGIESRLEVVVVPDQDCELQRLTLSNGSERPRTLAITSLIQIALNHPRADAGHPAFSKLFITTERVPDQPLLLACRRPRGADEKPVWLAHGLSVEGSAVPGTVETDRMRFLGRGRTAADPIAMESGADLSGTVGNVLDPVASIRHAITLPPGGRIRIMASLAFGPTREAVVALLQSPGNWDTHLAEATRREIELRSRLGIGAALSAALPHLTGAVLYGHRLVASPQRPPDPEQYEQLGRVDKWWAAHGLSGDAADPVLASRYLHLTDLVPSHGPDDAILSAAEPGRRRATSGLRPSSEPTESLRHWNGRGGFSPDGTEYVIHIGADGVRPPLPWTNVIANEQFGTVVSESGAATTWCGNSRENRLTPWFNDPVSDPHGEAIYLRDEETGASWSPTPGPRPASAAYEIRHGFGYTRFAVDYDGLQHELMQFIPRDASVKVSRLRVTNHGERPRQLAVYAYAQLVLGSDPRDTQLTTTWVPAAGAMFAIADDGKDFPGRVAVISLSTPGGVARDATADRTAFLGRHGATGAPAAVVSGGPLDGQAGRRFDPCAALRVVITIGPGQTTECSVLLGEAASAEAGRELIEAWRDPAVGAAALTAVQQSWRTTLGGFQVQTPVPALDLMVNGWLAYQNLSCRMWGRTAFYQSGGAFGFRDQLQDALALLLLDPAVPRRQILLHAAHQFVEGDVLHWWHPPAGQGIRTRFADDLLWLPLVTAQYVEQTGDRTLLDESVGFLRGAVLAPAQDEVFLRPEQDGGSASVYEHCCRALDRSLGLGVHGLPLFGSGDWNDGMNRVGREGRGESVWMGFFLARVLEHFIPIARDRSDHDRAGRYQAHRAALITALNDGGWDGGWYRRGYFDDGTPLGSAQSEECRIDAIAQAWAVLSGAASTERATTALDALEAHLVSERDGIIRLLTPPFDLMPHDPGYIKGYLPGVRENGGQYTHGALWAVQALAESGRADRAARLLTMLSPVTRGGTAQSVAAYQVEPYVIAADVYGVPPHIGRGGWTWYTGSAGWMFRVAVESILGLSLDAGRFLVVRPAIPESWPGCAVDYRLPDGRTRYRLSIRRANDRSVRETTARLDGHAVEVRDGQARIPLIADGGEHAAEVVFHPGASLRYRPRP